MSIQNACFDSLCQSDRVSPRPILNKGGENAVTLHKRTDRCCDVPPAACCRGVRRPRELPLH